MCCNCLLFWQQVICVKSLFLEQVTSKYSERLHICLNNYHCNVNSKSNYLFHSLNVIECTIYQCYIIFIPTYPSGKSLFKSQGPVNVTFKEFCFGRINCRVYMRRSKRLDYKQSNETGEKVKKEEVQSNQFEKVSNLFRTIPVSKDLQSLNVEESMDK